MSDLSLYYNETINKYRNKYVFVMEANRDSLIVRDLLNNDLIKIAADEITPINNQKVGFVNTYFGCVSVERIATRSPKEGLHSKNIQITHTSSIGWFPFLFPKEFVMMLNNQYPTVENAIRISKERGILVAYSRINFINGNDVYRRDRKIGEVRNGKIFLFDKERKLKCSK